MCNRMTRQINCGNCHCIFKTMTSKTVISLIKLVQGQHYTFYAKLQLTTFSYILYQELLLMFWIPLIGLIIFREIQSICAKINTT